MAGGNVSAPLLNISKIKEKMAQGGSRVMASFKADSSRSSPTPSGVATAMAASAVAAVAATTAATSSATARSAEKPPPINSKVKVSSQSSLTNDQLTAHLTAEERAVLEKVSAGRLSFFISPATCHSLIPDTARVVVRVSISMFTTGVSERRNVC